MTERLANVIYGAGCVGAALWVSFALYAASTAAQPEWNIALPIAAIGAVIMWGVGRVVRYVLAGR